MHQLLADAKQVGWLHTAPPPGMAPAMIRPARADELGLLAAIEDAAAEAFRGTAMAFVLDGPARPIASAIPPNVHIWVRVDDDDRPVGFIEAEPHGDWLHLLELSVHPAAQRRGHGRALVMMALDHARAAGLARVSLTTDRLLPWNGPMYRQMGFRELSRGQQPRWLCNLIAGEIRRGFDATRRIAMARRP